MISGFRQALRSVGFFAGLAVAITTNATTSEVQRLSDLVPDGSPDAAFVEDIQRRAVLYFVEQTDPDTGLTRDRAPADCGESTFPASIAATGFALTGWCIADAREWLPAGEAVERVKKTLHFVANDVEHERGRIYHFESAETGKHAWRSEASTIDTALFVECALEAREYFDVAEVRELVDAVCARIDWRWALNGGTSLTHGWRAVSVFIPWRWDSYSELLVMYLLGIGAPAN